jgi:hypothetical protein
MLDNRENSVSDCQQMPHPEKKRQRLQGHRCNNDEAAVGNDFLASIESLSGDDVLANILGFLLPQEIMRARLNKKMREAAKNTIVPLTAFFVNSLRKYNAMRVMARALPNLQKITLGYLDHEIKYVDGEDLDEEWAVETASRTTNEIEFISNFTKLRELAMGSQPLNGRYPCFFNFPHLQKLSIRHCDYLKFDLEMLAGLPVLKELECHYNPCLTGNVNSLRVLKDTLEKLEIFVSDHVEGNFMDLADFPHLKELELRFTAVTGGVQDIGRKDFSSLTVLALPSGGNGGVEQVFQRISDATDVIRTPYLFQKQRPEIVLKYWHAMLSEDSPDRYESLDYNDHHFAPVYIAFVRAGTRYGYQWTTKHTGDSCEVNWLDPEPDRESAGYGKYMEELQKIEGEINYFKGFHQPPTQEEFESIWERISKEMWNDGVESEFDSDSGDDEMEDD